jgi:hypothetical protein
MGLYGPTGNRPPIADCLSVLPMHVYQFRRAPKRSASGGPRRPDTGRSVLCRPISVLRFDIVKRKRIRYPEYG